MIIRGRPGFMGVMFALRGSILPAVIPRLLLVGVVAAGAAWVRAFRPGVLPNVSTLPVTLMGLGLSIFLGFRNNACYDRWWEARKQWGALLVESRALGRGLVALAGPARAAPALRLIVGFAHGLAARLRDTDEAAALLPWLQDGEAARAAAAYNPSDAALQALARILAALRGEGVLDAMSYTMLQAHVSALGQVQGSCERIKSTPIPYAYTLLVHRTAWLFCLLLPFALADAGGIGAPFIATLVAYGFFGLDELGGELEEPFAAAPNAIPLYALARVVEIELRGMAGETDLPPPLLPVDYVLL